MKQKKENKKQLFSLKFCTSIASTKFYLKGQTAEIFFFILAIVIIGLLLLFGVKYIMELGTKINQIDVVQFKTDLEGYANDIRPVYGKWKKIEMNVPAGIDHVCFVQMETFTARQLTAIDKRQEGLCQKDSPDYNFNICQAWQDDSTQNVYVEPFVKLDVGITLGAMEVGTADEDYLCIDTSAHILNIRMTGKGDRVLVEEWR
ncbi:MAG: hypothetical protein HY832_01150 [Candidatus Aenigmarchaeota archaeon]|nr:hypothetical protein [Candidatus Aenigmarchaeota archaeon]